MFILCEPALIALNELEFWLVSLKISCIGGMKWILSHCGVELNLLLLLFPILSFRYQLSDEPHLDGEDQDAAGEKVCTLYSL